MRFVGRATAHSIHANITSKRDGHGCRCRNNNGRRRRRRQRDGRFPVAHYYHVVVVLFLLFFGYQTVCGICFGDRRWCFLEKLLESVRVRLAAVVSDVTPCDRS